MENNFDPVYTSFEPVDMQTPSGLGNGLREGYKHSYSLDNFSLDTLREALHRSQEQEKPIKIYTGRGGMKMFQEAFINVSGSF